MHSARNPRKALARKVYALVLLAMAALGACLQLAAEPVDPIEGSWLWHRDGKVTFNADGTVHNSYGFDGTWEYLHNPEVQRHYRIVWEHGKNLDEVVCAADGLSAHVHNQAARLQFDAHRMLPDTPAAGPTPVPPIPAPASVIPAKIVAAVRPATDPADPILGEWQWVHGQKATFMADGTMTSSNGMQGVWMSLRNPEAVRKYVLDWKYGTYTDHLSFDPTTRAGHIVTQKGDEFDVTQGPAASRGAVVPSKSGSYFGVPGGG